MRIFSILLQMLSRECMAAENGRMLVANRHELLKALFHHMVHSKDWLNQTGRSDSPSRMLTDKWCP